MPNPPPFSIVTADLDRPEHRRAVVDLIDSYAREPIGGGAALASEVRDELPDRLRSHPTTRIFLAYDGSKAVGIALCFLGFSTFRARPLLNVHDLAVHPEHRRRGIGRALLLHAAAAAREHGCCKLTLEVRRDNAPARALYESLGFEGDALFLEKPL